MDGVQSLSSVDMEFEILLDDVGGKGAAGRGHIQDLEPSVGWPENSCNKNGSASCKYEGLADRR